MRMRFRCGNLLPFGSAGDRAEETGNVFDFFGIATGRFYDGPGRTLEEKWNWHLEDLGEMLQAAGR